MLTEIRWFSLLGLTHTVMNTFFKKRKRRKWTLKSPNKETKNEIDYIVTENPDLYRCNGTK